MTRRRDYYRVLHVDPEAPDEVIKASYRTLMQRMRMHPDLGGDHASAALLNEAFRVLGHAERRASYDRWLDVTRHLPLSADSFDTDAHCAYCRTAHSVGDADPDRICSACGASLYPVQHHQGNEDSRRAISRLPRFMRVTFAQADPDRGIGHGMTQDISLAGMRLLTSSTLDVDTRLLIECEFCSAVGAVRSARRHAADTEGWEVGIQFLTMRLKRQRGSLISTVA